MRLITFKPKRGGAARVGVMLDDANAVDIGDVAKRARKKLPFDAADMVSLIASGKTGLAAIAALLKAAKLPVIVVEAAGRDPEAYKALVELAESQGIAVVNGRASDAHLCTTCAGLSCEPFKHWWLASDECQCIEREWIPDPEVREKTLPCHLCQTCHLEVVRGHHRWRTVICSACQNRAREFNARVGRKVLLQGIHSMVNGGPVLQAPATATPKRLKDFAEGLNGMFSGVVWFGQTAKAQRIERLRQLGFESGLVVPLEQLPVGAGLVVEAVEVRVRRHLEQVLVAEVRLREQREVVHVVLAASGPVEPARRDEVPLHAQHRVDAGVAGSLVEREDAVHVAVIGDADRGLSVGRRRGDDLLDPRGPVEHRVLGVEVQVREGTAHRSATTLAPALLATRLPRTPTERTVTDPRSDSLATARTGPWFDPWVAGWGRPRPSPACGGTCGRMTAV